MDLNCSNERIEGAHVSVLHPDGSGRPIDVRQTAGGQAVSGRCECRLGYVRRAAALASPSSQMRMVSLGSPLSSHIR